MAALRKLETYIGRLNCVTLGRGLEGQPPIPYAKFHSHTTNGCHLSWVEHSPTKVSTWRDELALLSQLPLVLPTQLAKACGLCRGDQPEPLIAIFYKVFSRSKAQAQGMPEKHRERLSCVVLEWGPFLTCSMGDNIPVLRFPSTWTSLIFSILKKYLG